MAVCKEEIQILLYTGKTEYQTEKAFIEDLLEREPYYSWNEGEEDRGAKFKLGTAVIVVLCQNVKGPVQKSILSIDVENPEELYRILIEKGNVQILEDLQVKPYGTCFFSILDPVGNKFNFYTNGH